MKNKKIETFYPTSQTDWRLWLEENHISKDAVWLVYYKKKANKPTLTWSNAVDEALCFGWIDSKAETVDHESFRQYFCKRKPNSTWSKINKVKVEKLLSENLIAQAGLDIIEIAKQNGSWTILDTAEELEIPTDLDKAFAIRLGSKDFFLSLSKSVRKNMLQWLVLAKQQETRQKRINEIVECAAQRQKPKQF